MTTLTLLSDLRESASWFPHSAACRHIVDACDRADIGLALEVVGSALEVESVQRTVKLRSELEGFLVKAQDYGEAIHAARNA